MLLLDAARNYALVRGLSARSEYQMTHSVAMYDAYLGRSGTFEDLTSTQLSEWIRSLELRLKSRSIKNHRAHLVGIWRHYWEQGRLPPVGPVRKVRVPAPCPIAWTADEIQRLLAGCRKMYARTRAYFTTLIMVAYETGLRRSDLFLLSKSDIRPDGTIMIVQHKTGRPIYPQLTPETLAAVSELPGDRPLAWTKKLDTFYWHWKEIRRRSGLGNRGALQQIRRTGATLIAGERGDVQGYLGHATPTMQRHYVDWSILDVRRPRPPRLPQK